MLTCRSSLLKSSARSSKGHSSNMTVKKESNPFTGGKANEAASVKQRSMPTTTSRAQGSSGQGNIHIGAGVSRTGPKQGSPQQKLYFNDPAQVQQWAASSATGFIPVEDYLSHEQYTTGLGDAPLMARTDSHPGSFPMSRSSLPNVPMQQTTKVPGNYPGMAYNDFVAADVQNCSALQSSLRLQQTPAFEGNVDNQSGPYNSGTWPYPTPTSDDMVFPEYARCLPLRKVKAIMLALTLAGLRCLVLQEVKLSMLRYHVFPMQ